jgi:general secretion pathway protein G
MLDARDITSLKHNELAPAKAAFTLIELLAVMAIMMVLAGLLIGVSTLVYRVAREAKARSNIEKILNALNEYRLENGAYPLSANVGTNDASILEFYQAISNWLPHGMNSTNSLVDPWGTGFRYVRTSAQSCRLYSFGADTKDGTTPEKADNIESGR